MVTINPEECKGCGLCVDACTPKGLALSESLNHNGYHPAVYSGRGCNGCGLCFLLCPEPGAIVVYKRVDFRVPVTGYGREMVLTH
jgi:NAD-dependent dihydropyrimidine dehydrogenase PreA subunit